MSCWVAREVFGEGDPKWMQFRGYMLHDASPEFRAFYLERGEGVAKQIKDLPEVKILIAHLMDSILCQTKN
jgi:hypothetical protein